MLGMPLKITNITNIMKIITLLLAATGALFLSSCASTKECASCGSSDTSMKACCKDAAAKGKKCEKCAAMGMKGHDMKSM